jgi:hypothetical protein
MITICGKKYSTETTMLDLRSNQLTAIPEEIKYFTNLEALDLSYNQITTIPEHIFDHLINIRFLDLSYNQITTIPEHIFDHLINIRFLGLSYNQITTIPEHLFDSLTNLRKLHIYNNKIKKMPEHIFDSLTNLESLDLRHNKITTIPEHIFDHLTNLLYLLLSHNEITAIPEHLFDRLINLEALWIYSNKITTISISILNCRRLRILEYRHNPIERMDVRIQRFIDNIRNPKTSAIFNDSQNVHSSSIQSSVKESINSLMRDPFTMDKDVMIKQLIDESPACLQSLLCYLDDKDVHSTLYLTFFEVFEKVWGRIIGSDFKADLIKRLDEEMMDSECKCFTGRMSRLVNVLVGFFTDINITISNNERIGAIISSVLKGKEMTDELKELCRKSLTDAEIEDDEIGKWLDV